MRGGSSGSVPVSSSPTPMDLVEELEHRNDVGTWQAGVMQNVTWWKDLDAPTLVLVK